MEGSIELEEEEESSRVEGKIGCYDSFPFTKQSLPRVCRPSCL
jgi:hypothetical protein